MDQPTCLIDGFGPVPVAQPQSVAELGDLVRHAATANQALYPLGGRTMLSLGLPPARHGTAVDVTQLDQVVDYPARDMTITVQAGISLARLQDRLRTENQHLPVDIPLAERATLGGSLATNTSGPRRLGYGTLRDYVIGISAVNDEGQEIKAGGRVVKNVAGYDLCKLFIGALGTLGIITQVTLKLRPLAEERAVVVLGCQRASLAELLDLLHGSRTRPTWVDLLSGPTVQHLNRQVASLLPQAPWVVVAGFEANRTTVAWQVEQVQKEISDRRALSMESRTGPAAATLLQALVELGSVPTARLSFKANLLPSKCAAFCQQAMDLNGGLLLQAHAGNGIVRGHVHDDLTLDHAAAMLRVLLDATAKAQGNLVVLQCPTAWKATLPIWGAPRGDVWLMRAIKEQLDPRRLFNPGRFGDAL